MYQAFTLASTYGSGSFSNCDYSQAAGTTCGTATGGSLVNTGSAAIVVTAVAVLILIAALVIQYRKKSPQD